MNSEMTLLEKEEKLLLLELGDLQNEDDQKEALLESKENISSNIQVKNTVASNTKKIAKTIEDQQLHLEIDQFNDEMKQIFDDVSSSIVSMIDQFTPNSQNQTHQS